MPYDDQTGEPITEWVKGATIGHGHLISESQWGQFQNGITEAQADALLSQDLSSAVSSVNDALTTNVNQQQFDALVILRYNIGSANFRSSSVLKMINNPSKKTSYPTAELAWKAWNKSQGKVNQGLINRRNAEWNIYSKGVYERW